MQKKTIKSSRLKKSAEPNWGLQKRSTVRPQGGQRLSFQGTVARSGLAHGFGIHNWAGADFLNMIAYPSHLIVENSLILTYS